MSTYSSKPVVVKRSAESMAEQLSDFSGFQKRVDEMTEEQRQKIGNVEFTKDEIKVTAPQAGTVVLKATERTPEKVVLTAQGFPVPTTMTLNMKAVDAESTEITGVIDIDLPMMLKPMIGPYMQKFADKFGELFSTFA